MKSQLESLPSISYGSEVAVTSLLASELRTALVTPFMNAKLYTRIIERRANLGMEESEFLSQC